MNKSKLLILSGAAGAVMGVFWLCSYINNNPPYEEFILTDDQSRRVFIAEYTSEPTKTPPIRQEITLPEDGSSKVYETYGMLQDKQRLPLSDYSGQNAVLWTYTLSGCPTARAELICTPDGLLLGAMCYDCTRFDLMYPLITSEV
ncbi:MAG: DUF4830 domain-containing protein [Oscillospiraceae bacterium]|nr:DUF4830 domain-containing protein [Oscillospiraceae bacterium]